MFFRPIFSNEFGALVIPGIVITASSEEEAIDKMNEWLSEDGWLAMPEQCVDFLEVEEITFQDGINLLSETREV